MKGQFACHYYLSRVKLNMTQLRAEMKKRMFSPWDRSNRTDISAVGISAVKYLLTMRKPASLQKFVQVEDPWQILISNNKRYGQKGVSLPSS